MEGLIPYIWGAGILQLLVASANILAIRMFRYRECLQAVSGHVAAVFVVQNVFIMLTVVGMAALCLVFAGDLSGSTALGRALSGFLAVFWSIRLVFQLFFYDRELRRKHRLLDFLFLATFVYLAAVFAIGASYPG